MPHIKKGFGFTEHTGVQSFCRAAEPIPIQIISGPVRGGYWAKRLDNGRNVSVDVICVDMGERESSDV